MSEAPELVLRIESLVLSGFPHVDRGRLGAALEGELARLFQDEGARAALAARADVLRLDAGSFTAAPDASPELLGAGIARALHAGLAQAPGERANGSP